MDNTIKTNTLSNITKAFTSKKGRAMIKKYLIVIDVVAAAALIMMLVK